MQVTQRRKPLQRRSAQTIEFILDAAAHILEHAGLAGYNTNAVAARAGISIGSLYQYFPRKEAITASLILRAHQDIVDALHATLIETKSASIDDATTILMNEIMLLQSKSPKLIRILEMEEERLPRTSELLALEAEIERLNRQFFGRYISPAHRSEAMLDTVARDTMSIVRSILDSAVQSGTLQAPDLHNRLFRTIKGYLAPLLG